MTNGKAAIDKTERYFPTHIATPVKGTAPVPEGASSPDTFDEGVPVA